MAQSALGSFLARFFRDTRGVVSIEFVMIVPMLIWTLMGIYVFFDGYRQSSINLKAAYTVSDVISRETAGIDDEYIDSMESLLNFLTLSSDGVALRVSVVRWDEGDDRFYVDWSTERGWDGQMTDANVMQFDSMLPVMANADRLIIVETSTVYQPAFKKTGLGATPLKNFVVTRPRFAPLVSWTGSA